MTSGSCEQAVGLCGLADLLDIIHDLCGRRVTLMGLGLFGGGAGAAQFLCDRGADLTVTDLRTPGSLSPTLEHLQGLSIQYCLGEHRDSDFTGADLVVANPAVPRTNRFLRMAQDAGVPITSPMNLFLALCPGRIAAVTGSNGKSTTTSMLNSILKRTGRNVWLGGNIGISLLPAVGRIQRDDIVVLELSSFQLEDAAAIERSPHVAVLTNITPNHLDRHGTMDDYARAKRNIVRFQDGGDIVVLNARDERLCRWHAEGLNARAYWFNSEPHPGNTTRGMNLMGERLVWIDDSGHEVMCASSDVPLPGRHNVENAMAAATAARCMGASRGAILKGLRHFEGLEHRMELVGENGGVRFYNDSFSTTPDSTVAALEAFRSPVTLIAGGYDKQLDLVELARATALRVDVLVTIGTTGPALAQRVREESAFLGRHVTIREVRSLEEAVREAVQHSMPGTSVLLSPGCASYDMFENCTVRGELFKRLVRQLFLDQPVRGVGA